MSLKNVVIIAFLCLSTSIFATVENKVLESETINVDGYLKEAAHSDQELESIANEIKKQKQEIVLNKVKAKKFKELSKSVEALPETTEEYLEEKKAAQKEIAEYNAKVKCLQQDAPGPECDKYVRRRN